MPTISLPQSHAPPPPDGCGACNACCIIPTHPELGKPSYARCEHLCDRGCGVYDTRPKRCSDFRCAWHLGWLGPRVDRRPDQCGVMFQFEPGDHGEWYLGIYEIIEGAARSDKARYLRDVLLASKNTRHLRLGRPAVRLVPFGADLPAGFAISKAFAGYVPNLGEPRTKTQVDVLIFDGRVREVLSPTPPPTQ